MVLVARAHKLSNLTFRGGVSSKGRHVDVTCGCVWGCLGVVGYRLGGVSGKGRHRDVCV